MAWERTFGIWAWRWLAGAQGRARLARREAYRVAAAEVRTDAAKGILDTLAASLAPPPRKTPKPTRKQRHAFRLAREAERKRLDQDSEPWVFTIGGQREPSKK